MIFTKNKNNERKELKSLFVNIYYRHDFKLNEHAFFINTLQKAIALKAIAERLIIKAPVAPLFDPKGYKMSSVKSHHPFVSDALLPN